MIDDFIDNLYAVPNGAYQCLNHCLGSKNYFRMKSFVSDLIVVLKCVKFNFVMQTNNKAVPSIAF